MVSIPQWPINAKPLERCSPPEPIPGELLLPVIGPFDAISAQLDHILTVAARSAKTGDINARNALFLALQPKLLQISRQIRFWMLPATWERADLEQEVFVVFAELVDAWSGGTPFTGYLLGHFSWRLRGAVRRARLGERLPAASADAAASIADDSWAAEELRILLDEVAGHFSAFERAILIGRICDGEGFGSLSHRLGVSRKTIYRHWVSTLIALRQSLDIVTEVEKQATGKQPATLRRTRSRNTNRLLHHSGR
jgi:RNA polymerase sigma factor (sigma-70 family)